jgi:hypothetical protein
MTYAMYDSTTAGDIPADAPMVAYYTDGSYAWNAADLARFPTAHKVKINVFHTSNDGDVLDIEKGCSETWCAPVWAKMRRDAGLAVPTFYCRRTMPWLDLYNQAAVIDALKAGGVDPAGVAWWFADYSGQPHIPDGGVACQYANDSYTKAHYDLSLVSESAPWIPQSGSQLQVQDHAAHLVSYQEDDMLQFTDERGTFRCDYSGAVYTFDAQGNPADGGRYLGGLNGHPSWNAGGGAANGPPFAFGPTPADAQGRKGYFVTTRDAAGNFHPYGFPGDGSLK